MQNHNQFSLGQLIKDLDVQFHGDPECYITGISPIQRSQSGHLTFLTNPLYRKYLATTKASAVILTEADLKACDELDPAIHTLVTSNPYYIYAKIAHYFQAHRVSTDAGIHPSSVIGVDTHIHPSVRIEANCSIGKNVKIGAHTIIGPGCVIDDGVEIGPYSRLDARVTLCHHVVIGERVYLASGVVIGSEGFGFANYERRWHKVPQLGTVIIGDDVDIGANTTIDRGAVEDTIIEEGVKLDNLIQIGHNVRIGAHTVMAGCVAVAGSTVIGKYCMIGGASCFNGHITIGDHVVITGMTAVTKSILEPGMYSSGIVGAIPNHEFRKNNARFHRLDNLIQRVKKIESILGERENNE